MPRRPAESILLMPSFFFWTHIWLAQPLDQSLPEIHSFAKNKLISVSRAFSHDAITELFNLPLSQIAFTHLQSLQQLMETTTLEDSEDVWSYNGGSSQILSSMVYKKLVGHHQTDPAFKI